MSSASEQMNGRASGPVLLSGFLVDLAHSASLSPSTSSPTLLPSSSSSMSPSSPSSRASVPRWCHPHGSPRPINRERLPSSRPIVDSTPIIKTHSRRIQEDKRTKRSTNDLINRNIKRRAKHRKKQIPATVPRATSETEASRIWPSFRQH